MQVEKVYIKYLCVASLAAWRAIGTTRISGKVTIYMKNKQLIIVGGANGVGKSTFAYQYKDDFQIEYLGADEIAKELSMQSGRNSNLQAGRLFFKRLEQYLFSKRSVIIESTLSGLGLLKKIQDFKAHGFFITIVYEFLEDVQLCKKRIRIRVKKGGHHVPDKDIDRRYLRSLRNFRTSYMGVADYWQILYNGLRRPVETAICENGKLVVLDDEYYNYFLELSK